MGEKEREDKEELKSIIYRQWEEVLKNYTPLELNDLERAQFERMIHAEEMTRKYPPRFRIWYNIAS